MNLLLYSLCATLLLIVLLAPVQSADPDLWGRISIGALIVQNHQFPYHDIFSYTAANAPWIDHEWLTGLIFYSVLVFLGEPFLLLLKYLLIFGTFFLIFYFHKRQYGISPITTLVGVIFLLPFLVMAYVSTVRSQVFSLFFYILFIILLERLQEKGSWKKTTAFLIFSGTLWGNLHGGFIMGILLCLLYGLGKAVQRKNFKIALPYWGIGTGIFVTTALFNPYGIEYTIYLLHAWGLDRRYITEWQPVQFNRPDLFITQLLVLVSGAVLIFHWLTRRTREPSTKGKDIVPVLITLTMTALMFKAVRFQPFLALTLAAYLPHWLQHQSMQSENKRAALPHPRPSSLTRILLPMLLLASLICLFYINRTTPLFKAIVADEATMKSTRQYPIGAIRYLRMSPYSGNLMTPLNTGEFIYWTLFPKFQVAMDGRYEEVYTQAQFIQNLEFYNDTQPQEIANYLNATQTNFILTPIVSPHNKVLKKMPEWKPLYRDALFLVYGRKTVLQRLPGYNPINNPQPDKIYTLADFTTQADLQRFILK